MKKSAILLTIILFLATVFNIFSEEAIIIKWVYLSKPLLVPLVALIFFIETHGIASKLKLPLSIAFIFSLLGDMLLMLKQDQYFPLGLGSFLVAQLFFVRTFWLSIRQGGQRLRESYSLPWLAGAGAYYLILIGVIVNAMIANQQLAMVVPVMIYGVVLCTMLLVAAFRKNSVSTASFQFTLIGALLFVSSDSILAINKFALNNELAYASFWIMSTYVAAQFFIMLGIAKGIQSKNETV